MALANRSIVAILYCSLLWGGISCPYYYIATGALSYFPPAFTFVVLPWLMACTSSLLLIFVSRSKFERSAANKLGRYFRPVLIVAVMVAMSSSYFIESKIANFTLFLPVEYWFYLIAISGLATTVSFVAIVATRPSRLERFIASKLSRGNQSYLKYRAIGYVVLIFVLVFSFDRLYQYYLYTRPRVP
jgi:hypothetical protein